MTAATTEDRTHPTARAAWRRLRGAITAVTLAPPSRLTLAEWADQFRRLSADLGEPGPWRTARVPYLREPMESITDPLVREVVVMKSARIGATQGLVCNAIGYYIHQEPSPIIAALPTEGDAKKFSKQLLQPMIDDTPVLRDRVDGAGSRESSNTIGSKSYPGGTLQIVGTTSPRNMRMVHGRIILGSEVDGWEMTAGEDGDPMTLLRKRADAYGAPKFVWESTPVIKGISRIERAFEASDQRFYEVPCPHCGERQPLEWGGRDLNHGIKWEKDRPDTAHYVCRSGCVIEEAEKYRMIALGAWVARNPGAPVRGYHLNALVSPFPGARWPLLVAQWMEAQGKPEQLKVFFNTVLGLPWDDPGARVDAESLVGRLEPYPRETCPAGVLALTRSVDVQGDRLETSVWGWGVGEECWLVDYEFIPGDPGTETPWRTLDGELAKSYAHASGGTLKPRVTFVDSGGHHTKEAYAYTRARIAQNVFAIKGSSEAGAPLLGKPKKMGSTKAILYLVGSFTGKEALMARLGKVTEPGPGFIHLPAWIDGEQLAQLTAEKLVTRYVGGFPFRKWVKTRDRNEMTDLWVYAAAGLQQLGTGLLRRLAAQATPAPAPVPTTDEDGEVVAPPAPRPARRERRNWVNNY